MHDIRAFYGPARRLQSPAPPRIAGLRGAFDCRYGRVCVQFESEYLRGALHELEQVGYEFERPNRVSWEADSWIVRSVCL